MSGGQDKAAAAPAKGTHARAVQALQYDGTNGADVIAWVSGFLTQNAAYAGQRLVSSAEAAGVLTFTWAGGTPSAMRVNTGDYVILDVLTFHVVDGLSFGLTYPQ